MEGINFLFNNYFYINIYIYFKSLPNHISTMKIWQQRKLVQTKTKKFEKKKKEKKCQRLRIAKN